MFGASFDVWFGFNGGTTLVGDNSMVKVILARCWPARHADGRCFSR